MEPPDTGASIALGLVAGAMSLGLAFAGRLGSHATPVATAPIPLPGVPRIGRGTVVTGVGILGTVAESGLLHFRGAFRDPFMVLAVTVPLWSASIL